MMKELDDLDAKLKELDMKINGASVCVVYNVSICIIVAYDG